MDQQKLMKEYGHVSQALERQRGEAVGLSGRALCSVVWNERLVRNETDRLNELNKWSSP